MAALVLCAFLAVVMFLYGRSVFRSVGHSVRELMQFLMLVMGLLFIAAMMALLFLHT